MGNTNSEGICQQNDNMAKECCNLAKEHNNINGRTQLLKLVGYYSQKENSLHLVMFIITGYLAKTCLWSIILITFRVVSREWINKFKKKLNWIKKKKKENLNFQKLPEVPLLTCVSAPDIRFWTWRWLVPFTQLYISLGQQYAEI